MKLYVFPLLILLQCCQPATTKQVKSSSEHAQTYDYGTSNDLITGSNSKETKENVRSSTAKENARSSTAKEHARSSNDNGQLFKVRRVVDGDTFIIEDGSKKGGRVRLLGVDAPESAKSERKEIQFYGLEAKQYLTKLLVGKTVRLTYDVGKQDQYGRILAYAYLGDHFINADLIKNGYAKTMTIPPNVRNKDYFLKLQREAREKQRGLWTIK
ncbi:thermonuclease family protein [Sphingobacteriaceae bacterium WQ 2009]|uniref:Thermonuclease family protein n=1 Tax=Rhinopithecimicrobium faecis TaxID=2820698 RepID=A0A8T4HCQ5_9SPHI|nr:thermonuclease family protein [Sphingobacteriaceae bacterium WQ 2009]